MDRVTIVWRRLQAAMLCVPVCAKAVCDDVVVLQKSLQSFLLVSEDCMMKEHLQQDASCMLIDNQVYRELTGVQ